MKSKAVQVPKNLLVFVIRTSRLRNLDSCQKHKVSEMLKIHKDFFIMVKR